MILLNMAASKPPIPSLQRGREGEVFEGAGHRAVFSFLGWVFSRLIIIIVLSFGKV